MDSVIIAQQCLRKWILWHSSLLLMGLLLMLFQLQAQASRVAISDEDYPPFYYGQGDNLSGLSVDILQVIASELGLTIQWHRLPWSRVVQHVASGKADAITVFYKTPLRQTQFYFSSESYLRDPIVILCAEPCQLRFDGDFASLEQHPLAVVRGFSYGDSLDQASFAKSAVAESDPMLFRLLLNRRLAHGMASLITVQHSAELQLAKHKIQVLQPPLDYVDIYFAFSKQSEITPEFVAKFDQALHRYKSSAAYTALLQRYQLD